jgi:hypothetical protein
MFDIVIGGVVLFVFGGGLTGVVPVLFVIGGFTEVVPVLFVFGGGFAGVVLVLFDVLLLVGSV